jgi:predicted phosphodiesterase
MRRGPKEQCQYCTRKPTGIWCAAHESAYYDRGLRGEELYYKIRSKKPRGSIERAELEAASSQETVDQILHLRDANKELEKRIESLRTAIGEQKEFAHQVASAVTAAQPIQRIPIPVLRKQLPVISPVLMLSDLHIGEVVNKEEVEGFNEFNWKIAQTRMANIVTDFIKWNNTLRNGYKITRCVVACLGDYVSGNIHDELEITNEFPLPVQTARAGLLIGEALVRLSSAFDELEVYQVGADNHGRLRRKPQMKQKYENSMSYLVDVIAAQYANKQSNIEIHTPTSMKTIATISGFKFLLSHGDGVRAWMGIPYYGIERARAREAVKRMNTDRSFDYIAHGHWHVPVGFLSGNIFINGSLSGTNELDESAGRLSDPAQAAFLVGRHGVFGFTPFRG